MSPIKISKSEQLVNELPRILTEIGASLNNSAVKKGILWLSDLSVFANTLKDFLYDPKLVRTDKDIHNAVKFWCTYRKKSITK